MPAINGQEFMNRIHQLQPEIWLNGKKITDICNHEAFKGILTSKAALFDLQMNKDHMDLMTYVSPVSGERVGTSFMQPRTKEDLEKRRLSTQAWAKLSGGMMGRSPDYMNSCLMALGTAWDHFEDSRLIGKHILQMYERARENDLTLAHTFVNPQVNRSMLYFEDEEHPISAKVVKETSDGIIIKGARLLATQGGITDELLVLPIGGKYIGESFIYAFSIPSNTPNLRFICRESFRYRSSAFDHPLGARFEEMDTIVVFDDVLVPWERVFLYNDYSISMELANETKYFTFLLHQATARQVVKTEFILGLAQLIVDSIDIGSYTHVQGKVSEIISSLETLKALLLSSERNAKLDKRGRMVPDVNPLSAAITTFPRLYPRFLEILETLGASGLISIPTEKDFESPIRGDLDQYLQGASCEAKERTQLFRLAWDVCLSAFGGRQKQYERFFFGDPVRLESGLYNSYSKESAVNLAKSLLNSNQKKE